MTSTPAPYQPTTPWWVNLAWRLYAPAPAPLDPLARAVGRVVRPFADVWVPVCVQHGATHPDGQTGSLVIAGRDALANAVAARFFVRPPRTEPIGVVPLWRLRATLARLGGSADATVALLDRCTATVMFGSDHLLVPYGVSQSLRIPPRNEIMASVERPVERWLRRTLPIFTAEVSHAMADFEAFYRTMYAPFARHRFGSRAIVLNVHKLRRAFRRGGIVWARRDGQRVAGCLFQEHGHAIQVLVLGTADGDPDVEATGALYALYFFALEHAAGRGLTRMDFGQGSPVLSAGVLRHKSWWGARLVDDRATPTCLAVRWEHANGRVRSFLARHPLIFHDHDGLSAVTALDGGVIVPPNRLDRLRRSVSLPGLRRLVVVPPAGREAEYLGAAAVPVSPDNGCRLVVCREADVWAMVRR